MKTDERAEGRVVSRDDAIAWVAEWRRAGLRVVFANGTFDLLQVRHARALAGARAQGDRLVVAVHADRGGAEPQAPGRPIVVERDRALLVAALRCVDLALVVEEGTVDRLLEQLAPVSYAKGIDDRVDAPPRDPAAGLRGVTAIAGKEDALPVSVLLLAHDEAPRLAALLPTLQFARDVVVVDSGSSDGTREVAERLGARVFRRVLDGFGPQRQYALEQCREDWVLWVDADERLDSTAERAIREIVTGNDAVVGGFRLERRTWFMGRRIRYCGWGGERVLRLFRRSTARFDDAPVHERVIVQGAVGDLPGTLVHHSYETWHDCRDKMIRYAAAGAERARRAGRRAGPLDVLVRPPLRFLRMYVGQAGFLDGARGLVVCALAATQVMLKYAELWSGPQAGAAGGRGGAEPERPPARAERG